MLWPLRLRMSEVAEDAATMLRSRESHSINGNEGR